MAKKKTTPGQLRRKLRDTQERIMHERENVSRKLINDGFTQKAATYLTARAQLAPSEVIRLIEKEASSPKVAGSVKRCINLIKKLNGNWKRYSRQAEKMGVT